jgi:hypothetical protein
VRAAPRGRIFGTDFAARASVVRDFVFDFKILKWETKRNWLWPKQKLTLTECSISRSPVSVNNVGAEARVEAMPPTVLLETKRHFSN